jgi:moderate conductance mechanosensitive channel
VITIAVVLLAAMVATWLARRATHKLVDRLVRANEERIREAELALGEAPVGMDDSAPPPPKLGGVKLSALPLESARIGQRVQTLGSVLRNAATVIIWTIAVLIILGEFDISLAPILAGAGVAGVAFGFGAQYIVNDLLSGMFILFEDQYGVGDIVDLGDGKGTVEEVTLRVTRLRDVRGTVWFVPNGQIKRVGNKSQLWARVILDVDVAYDTDIARASQMIKQVADEVWRAKMDGARVLEEPSIWGVEQFGADAIVIRLAVKTKPGEQWAVARHIRARLKEAFDEAGIVIPFPQRTIWVNPVGDTESTGSDGHTTDAGRQPPQ